MASFNRVILLGNLTRDVEVRYLQSGTAVADIGMAVNDRRKGQNGEWVPVGCWKAGNIRLRFGCFCGVLMGTAEAQSRVRHTNTN